MKISWKRIGSVLAIVAGGTALFFLSTFSFLAMRGHLDTETLARLPVVGRLFEERALATDRAAMAAVLARMHRMERSLGRLETRLGLAQEHADESSIRQTSDGSVLFEVDPITVNLRGSNAKRFLKSRFTLGIETADEEEAQETLDTLFTAERRAVIRDAMMRVCREKSLDEIEDDFELDGLRKEIAEAVQSAAFGKRPGRVKEVYVNEFLVQ